MKKYQKPWKPSISAHEDMNSIVFLAKSILETKNATPKHKKYLIDKLIWKATEIHGKFNTQFVSEDVYNDKYETKFPIHEHVSERKKSIDKVIKDPIKIEEILRSAIACLVSKNEHKSLHKIVSSCNDWERYKSAGVKVYDRQKQCWV